MLSLTAVFLVSLQPGKLQSMKACGLWPRNDAYYKRNDWAGRLLHEDDRPNRCACNRRRCAATTRMLSLTAAFLVEGKLGKLQSMKACRLWPRDGAHYKRTHADGRLRVRV